MKTYHHYVDGKKVATYSNQSTKRKRHAVEHYRHMQRVAAIKDTATRLAIVAVATIILTAAALVGIN